MTYSTKQSKQGNSSTYTIHNSNKKAELYRLILQDQLVTTALGGVLSEQSDPGSFHRVLDVACGPGGWVMETAQLFPEMSFVGIDISHQMIEYAQAQAVAQDVNDRIEFRVIDVLRPLDFPANSFDLVNLRFGTGFLRTWDWPQLLLEMQRVARPGGMIRVTECEVGTQSSSQAQQQSCELLVLAHYRSGHLFTQERAGVTKHLATLLEKSWCEEVQSRNYDVEICAGTSFARNFLENAKSGSQALRPFIQKWAGTSKDFEALYLHGLIDMQKSDFHAIWPHMTAWGRKPMPRTT